MTVYAFVTTFSPLKNLYYCKAFRKTPLSLTWDAYPYGCTEDIRNVVPDFIPTADVGIAFVCSFSSKLIG